jgi:hypothetical protein
MESVEKGNLLTENNMRNGRWEKVNNAIHRTKKTSSVPKLKNGRC